jgi:hypothetical protein
MKLAASNGGEGRLSAGLGYLIAWQVARGGDEPRLMMSDQAIRGNYIASSYSIIIIIISFL